MIITIYVYMQNSGVIMRLLRLDHEALLLAGLPVQEINIPAENWVALSVCVCRLVQYMGVARCF